MDSVFIDTNVLIDVLQDRRPRSVFSSKIFELISIGLEVYISSLSIVTAVYVSKKPMLVKKLADKLVIQELTKDDIDFAFNSELSDFEDGVQYSICRMCSNTFLTWNKKDFKKATAVNVLTPEEYLNYYLSL